MDQIFDPKLHSPGGRDELTQQKQENLPQNGGGCRLLSTEEILSQQTSNITRSSCRGGCHDSFQTVTSCGLAATNNPTSSKTVLRHTFRPGQATNSIFFCFLFCEKSLICLEGKSMTPRRGNTILFRSSQQLPRLCLGPLKCFLS